MGMGTSGIPTTDNIPETTEKLGCPTDNIFETTEIFGFPTENITNNRFFKTFNFIIFIKNKSFSVVSGILSVVGIPPVPVPIPEEIQLLMYGWRKMLKMF